MKKILLDTNGYVAFKKGNKEAISIGFTTETTLNPFGCSTRKKDDLFRIGLNRAM